MNNLSSRLRKTLYSYGTEPSAILLLVCVWGSAIATFLTLAFLLLYILWQGLPNITIRI